MSWDHGFVVRGARRTREQIRAIAARLAKTFEGELAEDDDELAEVLEDDDPDVEPFDLGFGFPRGGGVIEVTPLQRGYRIYVDSQVGGNRASWQDIAELADLLGDKLGELVEDAALAEEMAAELLASRGDDDDHEQGGEAPGDAALSDVAIVRIEDRGGVVVSRLTVPVGTLLAAIDGGGMLRDEALAAMPALTEEKRFVHKAARIVAALHDRRGRPYRRHTWSCDGYGRVTSARVEDM